jgi:hypothetical protein
MILKKTSRRRLFETVPRLKISTSLGVDFMPQKGKRQEREEEPTREELEAQSTHNPNRSRPRSPTMITRC